MPITMQGSWTVSVRSKNAAFPQRFIIAGATSGNGTYNGEIVTPPVPVTGDHWTITIENDPGTGFRISDDRIKFPFIAGGQYHFDIESNDAGGDEDFNDLILRCHTPVTLTDFLVYGHVSYYDETCIFNPCFPLFAVIDSRASLLEALRNPDLRIPIEKLYPERIPIGPPDPGPLRESLFRPLVLPIEEEAAIPPKRAQLLKAPLVDVRASDVRTKAAKDSAEPVDATIRTASAAQTVRIGGAKTTLAAFDRVAVASIIDHIRLFCDTGPLPGVSLRFQEYDRTAAERAGGVYTGTGSREMLGACVTDRNGNYIFRFSRDLADFVDEIINDVAVGEGFIPQIMPDIIAQMLDSTVPGGIGFETAPYWNVPLLKRINICIPQGNIHRPPTACEGHNAIQALGRIPVGLPTGVGVPAGSPPGYGPRVGLGSFLGAEGRITVTNNLPNVPQARCAAWENCVDFFACFLDHPNVTQYTIRWRPHTETSWHFFTESVLHPKVANVGLPGYIGDLVGPHDSTLFVDDDGIPGAVTAPAYFNIENDTAWQRHLSDLKATICTGNYAASPRAVDFRIEGYDAAGHKVAGADDTITMFIDNETPDYAISSVEMLGAPGGDCALFTLPAGDERAPLTVRFKANELFGFMNSYSLSIRKGNTAQFSGVDDTPANLSHGAYTHGDNLSCNTFFGTRNAIGNFGLATVDLRPPGGANWLGPTQPFCTFAINLAVGKRATNGYNSAVQGYGTKQYLLGIQR